MASLFPPGSIGEKLLSPIVQRQRSVSPKKVKLSPPEVSPPAQRPALSPNESSIAAAAAAAAAKGTASPLLPDPLAVIGKGAPETLVHDAAGPYHSAAAEAPAAPDARAWLSPPARPARGSHEGARQSTIVSEGAASLRREVEECERLMQSLGEQHGLQERLAALETEKLRLRPALEAAAADAAHLRAALQEQCAAVEAERAARRRAEAEAAHARAQLDVVRAALAAPAPLGAPPPSLPAPLARALRSLLVDGAHPPARLPAAAPPTRRARPRRRAHSPRAQAAPPRVPSWRPRTPRRVPGQQRPRRPRRAAGRRRRCARRWTRRRRCARRVPDARAWVGGWGGGG